MKNDKDNQIRISQPSKKDKAQFMKLVRGLYGRSSKESIANWNSNYLNFINSTYVIKTENKIVAYMTLGVENNNLYIGDLYVLPEYRKRGFASILIKRVIEKQKKLNKIHLRVDVRKKDYPARHLYKKFGFRVLEKKGEKSLKLIK